MANHRIFYTKETPTNNSLVTVNYFLIYSYADNKVILCVERYTELSVEPASKRIAEVGIKRNNKPQNLFAGIWQAFLKYEPDLTEREMQQAASRFWMYIDRMDVVFNWYLRT